MFAKKKKTAPKTTPKQPSPPPMFFSRRRRTAPCYHCHTAPRRRCRHFGLVDLTWVWNKVVVA